MNMSGHLGNFKCLRYRPPFRVDVQIAAHAEESEQDALPFVRESVSTATSEF